QYEGYLAEPGVNPNSTTETYFKIKLALATPRWRGVAFTLEGGKGLSESKAEISVYFKKPVEVFVSGGSVLAEALKLKIQPKEGISIINHSGNPAEISFPNGGNMADGRKNDAYEKVLLDAVKGDQTLFTSTEEIVAEWNIVTPILEGWRNAPLVKYAKGTMPKNNE
ncbi:MAG: glucose-6-phosphate dehydrogenase, partial [bacterium]|nr:glucose-6-phosphate dehydrogenase [bacterium]